MTSVFTITTPVPSPTLTCARRPGYLIVADPDNPAILCNAVICVVGQAQDGDDFPSEVAAKADSSQAPVSTRLPPPGSQKISLPGTDPHFKFDHTTKEVPCDCTDAGKPQFLGVWARFGSRWIGPEIVPFTAKCCTCTECQTPPTTKRPPADKKKAALKKSAAKKKPAKKKK